VRACVRAVLRACVRACARVRACVRACIGTSMRVCLSTWLVDNSTAHINLFMPTSHLEDIVIVSPRRESGGYYGFDSVMDPPPPPPQPQPQTLCLCSRSSVHFDSD
jgi:hypothetical protein